MRIAFIIHTAGQAYFWTNIIKSLTNKGHEVSVLIRGKGMSAELLSRNSIRFSSYPAGGKTPFRKLLHIPSQLVASYKFLHEFRPDLVLGGSMLESDASAILRVPCIIFEDTEVTPSLERMQWRLTARSIVTPTCFQGNLGKKQIRVPGYKELAYLHPNYFKPDPTIFQELGISHEDKYVILRFNAFAAIHDVGGRGFTVEDKRALLAALSKSTRLFISAEGETPPDFHPFLLPTKPYRIHQVLYHAQMIVGDSGTMGTESAVLGTTGVMCYGLDRPMGNFVELEQKYGLLHVFRDPRKTLQKALELLQHPDLKADAVAKRRRLLADKVDVTQFMVDLIQDYPESVDRVKEYKFQYYKP